MKEDILLNGVSLVNWAKKGWVTENLSYSPAGMGVNIETVKGRRSPSISTGNITTGSLNFTVTFEFGTQDERDNARLDIGNLVSQETFNVTKNNSSLVYICANGGVSIVERSSRKLLDEYMFSFQVINVLKK